MRKGDWPRQGKREIIGMGKAYSMAVTAVVFHPETSPLYDEAPSNMYLGRGPSELVNTIKWKGGSCDREPSGNGW